MKLIQELLQLNEGRMKDAIMDLIDRAIDAMPANEKKNLKDDPAELIPTIRKMDNNELVAGIGDQELVDMIDAMIGESILEDEGAVDQEDMKPKILAKSASVKGVTYMVVMDPASEEVQIVDSSHKVYLQVPFIIWQQLSRQG